MSNANRLLRDRDGGLWIGTVDRGLIHLRNGRADLFRKSDGLSGDVILSLFEDREGNVWVASTGGLDRFRELPVTTISVRQGLSSDATQAVLAATDGSIWVGSCRCLDKIEEWSRRQSSVREAECRMRRNLCIRTIAGESGYLRVRDLPISPTAGSLASKACLAESCIYIAGDSAGNLWLSEQRNLLHLLDGRLVEQIPWSELGRQQPANNLLAEQGGVWLGFWDDGACVVSQGSPAPRLVHSR